ncbi:hypothetical protein [Microbacterium sp. JZ31]|uniref:hypothetical protein n=1 Tax=Microbacterium sp. JZ31 TaxID=1906274 RepID=UPI00193311BA|nr:hypothetical protein [Microbacterium sp. JZ31]
MGSAKVSEQMLDVVMAAIAPCTLPQAAYGPQSIEWHRDPQPVWAWISWPHKAAERVEGVARGSNDRVVMIEWYGDRGTLNTVVWRSAVRRRAPSASNPDP